jgi:hypothetical protein
VTRPLLLCGPLSCDDTNIAVSEDETDVTASETGFSIVSVRNWTEQLLTKRRAVDFCRVAAALCRMA